MRCHLSVFSEKKIKMLKTAFVTAQRELERCWFFCDRAQKQCRPTPVISEEGELRSAVFCQVTSVHLVCQIFMNDLLTEQGQQE